MADTISPVIQWLAQSATLREHGAALLDEPARGGGAAPLRRRASQRSGVTAERRPPVSTSSAPTPEAPRPRDEPGSSAACRPAAPASASARSRDVTDGMEAPARSMLRAVGMTDDDWDKPQLASPRRGTRSRRATCRCARLAEHAAKPGCARGGGFPLEFGTITVSDGISMGHEGMRASLVVAEVIADSVETVMHAERFDAFVGLAGMRQVDPGDADGSGSPRPAIGVRLQRLDPARPTTTASRSTSPACSRPSGPMPRVPSPRTSSATSSARPARRRACGGMFTANTMASIAEALGIALPARRRRRGRPAARGRCPASPARRWSPARARHHPARS